jgi:hypothetical protein
MVRTLKQKGGRPILKKSKKKKVEDILITSSSYNDYIINNYDYGYKNVKLDTKSGSVNWGLGVEHEAQLFHINKKEMESYKNTNMLFDSQESTCYLTNDLSKKGSCCRGLKGCYTDNKTVKKLMKNRVKLSKKDDEWLKAIPWEYTGRQIEHCEPSHIVHTRAPVLMPEIITTNHKNRTIESINNELLFNEKKFIDLQMKNPYTKAKVKKYGEIRTIPYGSAENILVPKKPSMDSKEYEFYPKRYVDYTGSYHITITLPCRENTTDKEFVKIHQNFANQFQWIEPLLLASLFSGDPRTITDEDYNKKIRGSFRVMAYGWGNLAGSDLRKLGTKGVDRMANIESTWRKSLDFKDTKKLMNCDNQVAIGNGIGVLSSDIRTFGFDFSKDCKKKYREDECPKVSGMEMKHPYGMEFRIFDHFNSAHLLDLLRFMVYLAENSRVFQTKNYVYNNLVWKTALRNIMTNGWRAILSDKYINELRKNLNLELNFRNKTAYGFMVAVNEELYMKHSLGYFPKLMIEGLYSEPPKFPEINRLSWQISFNHKYQNILKKLMKENFKKGQKINLLQFKKVLFTKFKKKIWDNYVTDILFALEAKPYKMLELNYPSGKIIGIKYIK